jgi:hypothetical protein
MKIDSSLFSYTSKNREQKMSYRSDHRVPYRFDDLREISDRRLLDLRVNVDLEIQKRRNEAEIFLSLTENLPLRLVKQTASTTETPGAPATST